MTTDERDPLLQTLFADAQLELTEETFTAKVMSRSRLIRYRVLIPWVALALLLAAGAWFLGIPVEVAQFVTQVLNTTLFELGDSWLAWMLSPVNNVAALIVIVVKAIRIGRRKLIAGSYA